MILIMQIHLLYYLKLKSITYNKNYFSNCVRNYHKYSLPNYTWFIINMDNIEKNRSQCVML